MVESAEAPPSRPIRQIVPQPMHGRPRLWRKVLLSGLLQVIAHELMV